MLAKEYIIEIMKHCQHALNYLNEDNKRLAIGKLDEINDKTTAAKWILINEIKETEGKF